MRIVGLIEDLRRSLDTGRRAGRRIGFVPTMGAFHEGHLSLMRRARAECDVVVVSLFVNPAQFTEPADLAAYPRDDARDERLAAAEGVDVLFMPPVNEIYPPGFATTVEVHGVTEPLEGAARGAAHFRGVATVVTKLFQVVQPDVAYFGQKDVQQCVVIRRLVRDLDMPVRIEVCPTVREKDGLAMSSRNVRLSQEARARAVGLSEALRAADAGVKARTRSTAELVRSARGALAARGIADADVEYLAIVSVDTLMPLDVVEERALVVIAARLGGVRLIDNAILEVPRS
ncbi:MAG TPA: pantoate--beta-alanine ligase [Gemmatimonadaceae bacterium]|nr:pantoate--beta-alanine ligase [Gemmatimonadaceae bacterium]